MSGKLNANAAPASAVFSKKSRRPTESIRSSRELSLFDVLILASVIPARSMLTFNMPVGALSVPGLVESSG